MTVKTKAEITLVQKNGLNFMVEDGHRPRRFRPWPGDSFSFLYDRIMKDSVFPRKSGGDTGWHYPFTIYNTLSQRVDVPPAGAAITVVMVLAGSICAGKNPRQGKVSRQRGDFVGNKRETRMASRAEQTRNGEEAG